MKYIDLLKIQCKDCTNVMATFLHNHLAHYGKVSFDEGGNLWFSRGSGNRPLIVSHMDTVQEVDFRKVFSEKSGIVSGSLNGRPCGIGADDKNGIYIAIRIIEETDIPIKCLFTWGEETGAMGAYSTSKEDLDGVLYMVQFDRKGNSDIIAYCSDDFLNDIWYIGEKYGYSEANGIFTDVSVLSQLHGISAVNLSCGYYNAHTSSEYTVLKELDSAYLFAVDILESLTDFYPLEIQDEDIDCYKCVDFQCENCQGTYGLKNKNDYWI